MFFYGTQDVVTFTNNLDGLPLLRVDQIKNLGFLYVPSLDFQPHIDFIENKALRVIGFLGR